MYLISKALVSLDANLIDEDDYWSMNARKLLSLSIIHAK